MPLRGILRWDAAAQRRFVNGNPKFTVMEVISGREKRRGIGVHAANCSQRLRPQRIGTYRGVSSKGKDSTYFTSAGNAVKY
jgi:hypothetical protein